MTLTVASAKSVPGTAVLRAIAVIEGDAPAGFDIAMLKRLGFEAKFGQTTMVPGDKAATLLVGLGKADELNAQMLRRIGVNVARSANGCKHIASEVLDGVPGQVDAIAAAQSYAEGLALGAYTYTELKSEPSPSKLTKVSEVGVSGRALAAMKNGLGIAEGVIFARDLVNEPGGSLTPPAFARKASRMARTAGLTVKVMDKKAIEKAKLGGLLGVNRGSFHPPQLVQITYEPDVKAKATLALVGKGITFDAGGLSIKTGTGMMTMKCDMGGGAAVLGAMMALPVVKPKIRVVAYVPMTDNMLGPDATRPGDVLTIRNGKTVEVLNTDAEGRLILADGLSLASEAKPDAIVDLATLTGACMVALGPEYAGLMSNDDEFVAKVKAAADAVDESTWHLPLPDSYRKMLDSPIADIKNIGGPYAGALTAGLFLKEFVADGIPWTHIDLAGPAFTDADHDLGPRGGTGYGVRLLVELARTF